MIAQRHGFCYPSKADQAVRWRVSFSKAGMTKSDFSSSSPIAEDAPFQEQTWRAQRIGWLIFALIICAAALGLFGQGPLSFTSVEQGRVRLEYDRFIRFESPTSLKIYVAPAGSGTTVAVWIAHDYLAQMDLIDVSPTPREVRAATNRQEYIFVLQDPSVAAWITFRMAAARPGLLSGQLGLANQDAVQFSQLVYP
jgi:hypothetical protein